MFVWFEVGNFFGGDCDLIVCFGVVFNMRFVFLDFEVVEVMEFDFFVIFE